MAARLRKLGLATLSCLLFAGLSWGQTGSIEGTVKGEDGQPLKDALIQIERLDIKGNYKVKTNKKGHYFHAGLPLGRYKVTLVVDGQQRDVANGVQTRLGDPITVDFDLAEIKKRQQAMQQAAETGTITQEQARDMTPEQRAALEKQIKERQKELAKDKALNDAFNAGMEALKTKQFATAVQQFTKASEIDPKQYAVWANLAEAYMGLANSQTGAEQTATIEKGLDAFRKAVELKPEDGGTRNNYALALARAKKLDEAKAELTKAAELEPTRAGQYFYNLGAVLTNTGQTEAAGEAFKKAVEADPNYAEAQYQYGIYLVGKAKPTPDGKFDAPPGTREAFEKYLQLKPDGPNAESAKAMIASLESKVQTEYNNPAAEQKKKSRKK